MADESKPKASKAPKAEEGAPIPKDAIDPELVKLGRKRIKVNIVTAAGVVFLAIFFLWKLTPDRRFAGSGDSAKTATVADIVKGNVDGDSLVSVQAEPMMSHAIRAAKQKTGIGVRVVPVRGSSEKLWLVIQGDGWEQPSVGPYVGRLRVFDDLPLAKSVTEFLSAHPRPLFATASATRAGFATGKVTTVAGDEISVRDTDRVGFDVTDPNAAIVVCTYTERHKDLTECTKVIGEAGIAVTGKPRDSDGQAYFDVQITDAAATLKTKLEAAQLWATRVDPVTRHYETTWGKLKGSGPVGFTVDGTTHADATLDLVGLYVTREIPSGAYAIILGEKPADYWYVLPVSIVVGVLGLLFLWALVRAVKRDLLPARA